jgi:hypothetical protein
MELHSILLFNKQQENMVMRRINEAYETYAVSILQYINKLTPDQSLMPIPDPASPIAFSYPDLKDILGERTYLDSVILNQLEKEQYLFADFYERILLCPYCLAYNICFRDICPECDSADLINVQMIHHFSCGYMGKEHEFHQDGHMICPKCSIELQHIGKDFERPAEVYTCGQCDWSGSEAVTSGHCIVCDKEVKPVKCVIRDIKSYRITPAGKASAENNELQSAEYLPIRDTGIESFKVKVGSFYNTDSLLVLANEFGKLTDTNQVPLTGLFFHPDVLVRDSEFITPQFALAFIESLAEKMRLILKPSGYLSIIDEWTMFAIIPGTSVEEVLALVETMLREIRELSFSGELPKTTLSIGIAQWDSGAARLLEDARTACLSAQNAGGNQFVMV